MSLPVWNPMVFSNNKGAESIGFSENDDLIALCGCFLCILGRPWRAFWWITAALGEEFDLLPNFHHNNELWTLSGVLFLISDPFTLCFATNQYPRCNCFILIFNYVLVSLRYQVTLAFLLVANITFISQLKLKRTFEFSPWHLTKTHSTPAIFHIILQQ